jgi:hypothetical protein
MLTGQTEPAPATAEHRVARDSLSEPGGVGAVSDRRDTSSPFVTETQGEVGKALFEVSHFAGVELDVCSADADTLDVNQQMTWSRHWRSQALNGRAAWTFDDECAHHGLPNGSNGWK